MSLTDMAFAEPSWTTAESLARSKRSTTRTALRTLIQMPARSAMRIAVHKMWRPSAAWIPAGLLVCLLVGMLPVPASADRLENQVAVFAALDKVTARISKLPVPLNETQQFGSLKVTPRVCYSRPPDEQPKTTTFVEVEEVMLDGQQKRLFTGWMFADSPGLNAVEHPVYDVWLTGCEQPATASGPRPVARDAKGAPVPAKEDTGDTARRRVRR